MKYSKTFFFMLPVLLFYCAINQVDAQGKEMLNVRVLSINKCEATPPTIDRVKSVAKAMSIEINLEHMVIETQEKASKERFIGSPTVQVNGLDIEPSARKVNQFGVT